jgi:hypothetical protein
MARMAIALFLAFTVGCAGMWKNFQNVKVTEFEISLSTTEPQVFISSFQTSKYYGKTAYGPYSFQITADNIINDYEEYLDINKKLKERNVINFQGEIAITLKFANGKEIYIEKYEGILHASKFVRGYSIASTAIPKDYPLDDVKVVFTLSKMDEYFASLFSNPKLVIHLGTGSK